MGKRPLKSKCVFGTGAIIPPDWSQDFFEAGGLPYDDETNTYTVPDVEYCIEQAEDWRLCRGDFADDAECYDVINGHERCVFVND